MPTLNKIHPCLWFDGQGEEAANFYVSVFPNSRIVRVSHYTAEGRDIHKKEPGTVLTVDFELDGQPFTALNGGPQFRFSEAVSFIVSCETQAELDRYWAALSADPAAEICGWCKDRFGLSWQIVPARLPELMTTGSEVQRNRVMKAVMASKKLDIAQLEAAYRG